MKNKKLLRAIAALTVGSAMAAGCLSFTACGHTHSWSDEYTPDGASGHYQICTGCDEHSDTEAHNMVDGECTICHWKSNSTGGEEENPNPPQGGGEEENPPAAESASWIVPVAGSESACLTTSFNSGEGTSSTIEENSLFTLEAGVSMSYSFGGTYGNLQKSGSEVKLTPNSGTEVALDQGIKLTDAVNAGATVEALTLTAKKDAHVKVYVVWANDSFNSNKTGIINYSVDGGLVRHSAELKARNTIYTVEVDLSEGQVLTIGATNTHPTDTGKLWLFGAEAAPDEKDITVTYRDGDNNWLYQEKYNSGATLTKPADPQMENHKFLGWFTTADGDTSFTFGSAVTEDITVYAHYLAADVTVNIYTSADGTPTTVMAYSGEKFAQPETPEPENGYLFDGWYTDADYNTKYNFDTLLTANSTLNLYAHFVADTTEYTKVVGQYTYTVNSTGDAVVATAGTNANIDNTEALALVTYTCGLNKSSSVGFFNVNSGSVNVKIKIYVGAGSTISVTTDASSNSATASCTRVISATNATKTSGDETSSTISGTDRVVSDAVVYTANADGFVEITITKGGSNGMRLYNISLTIS